jgi:hypothetical protein
MLFLSGKSYEKSSLFSQEMFCNDLDMMEISSGSFLLLLLPFFFPFKPKEPPPFLSELISSIISLTEIFDDNASKLKNLLLSF